MAAPINVRAESNSETTVILNWTGGSGTIGVYRALHGGSFTLVATLPAGTLTYTDLGLATGTYYDYKLSDDGGGTFSSVVSVQTQTCALIAGNATALQLPRVGDGTVAGQDFNTAMDQLEKQNVADSNLANPCLSCPVNGAVIFDCTNGCQNFLVNATTDINSISINSCDLPQTIVFNIPPNTTRRICGWPAGVGFTGDECFNAPIVAGPQGRHVTVGLGGGPNNNVKSASSGNGYGGGSGGAGQAQCTCVPGSNGELTIKCCSANCSLSCSSTKALTLKACGGQGPYSWTRSSSVTFTSNGKTGTTATGSTVIVTPPANSGSAVAGSAYTKQLCFYAVGCATCNAPNFAGATGQAYGCNDQFTSPADGSCGITDGSAVAPCATLTDCANTGTHCVGDVPCEINNGCQNGNTFCNDIKARGKVRDVRSGSQISAGCNPCGLSSGVTITVTDSLGVSVNITLRS